MTDRLKGLTVAFHKDIRDDDAQCIIDAILMIKGVADVTTSIVNPSDYMNRSQLRIDIRNDLLSVVDRIWKT